jgi:hypothetical protein
MIPVPVAAAENIRSAAEPVPDNDGRRLTDNVQLMDNGVVKWITGIQCHHPDYCFR